MGTAVSDIELLEHYTVWPEDQFELPNYFDSTTHLEVLVTYSYSSDNLAKSEG
jgi:hypothetical protein